MSIHPILGVAFTALLLAGTAPAQAPGGDRYALLVACQEYNAGELKSLSFTRSDIIAFRGTLIDSGFSPGNVVLLHDRQPAGLRPDGRTVRDQIDRMMQRVGPDDTLIVALSGHGVQFKGETKNYFCPSDAALGDPTTLIPLDDLYRQLGGCPARRKLLLVDACRNDPQSRLAKGGNKPSLESVTRPQTEAVPEGIVALFSCSAGQESYEHPGLRHGVFFHTVLQGWDGAADANGDGTITLNELSEYVQRETPRLARQEPLRAVQVPQQRNDVSGVWVLREPDPVGEVRRFGRFSSGLRNAFLSEDGLFLIACTRGDGTETATADDGNVRPELSVWDAHTGAELRRYTIRSGVS